MKSKQLKRGTVLVLVLLAFCISSFGPEKKQRTFFCDNGELPKVKNFVLQNICQPMSQARQIRFVTVNYCVNGYLPVFTTDEALVTTDRFVNGRILLYQDCNPQRVCDFKVCVAQNFVMVKSEATGRYLSVREWILSENKKGNGSGC